jgi:hypothetical protein
VDCLVLFFVGLAGYSLWDMLFAGVRRVGDGWLGCVDLSFMRGVVEWLVVWQRIYVVVRLVFRVSVVALVRRLARG